LYGSGLSNYSYKPISKIGDPIRWLPTPQGGIPSRKGDGSSYLRGGYKLGSKDSKTIITQQTLDKLNLKTIINGVAPVGVVASGQIRPDSECIVRSKVGPQLKCNEKYEKHEKGPICPYDDTMGYNCNFAKSYEDTCCSSSEKCRVNMDKTLCGPDKEFNHSNINIPCAGKKCTKAECCKSTIKPMCTKPQTGCKTSGTTCLSQIDHQKIQSLGIHNISPDSLTCTKCLPGTSIDDLKKWKLEADATCIQSSLPGKPTTSSTTSGNPQLPGTPTTSSTTTPPSPTTVKTCDTMTCPPNHIRKSNASSIKCLGTTCDDKTCCTRVACPANSTDEKGQCKCNDGYTGTITWNTVKKDYDGACTAVLNCGFFSKKSSPSQGVSPSCEVNQLLVAGVIMLISVFLVSLVLLF